jgi:DNA-binding transcriptional MerR regulator
MEVHERELTLEELAERVQVPVRTIRFYISEGLLPGPGTRGKGASYGEGHLLRLQLIRRLAEQHVPLAEMRSVMGRLSLEEVQALLAEQEQQAAELERRSQAPSPKDYISALLNRAQDARQGVPAQKNKQLPASSNAASSGVYSQRAARPASPKGQAGGKELWYRWELAPGVELHIKAEVEDQYRQLIERLRWLVGAPEEPPGQ